MGIASLLQYLYTVYLHCIYFRLYTMYIPIIFLLQCYQCLLSQAITMSAWWFLHDMF